MAAHTLNLTRLRQKVKGIIRTGEYPNFGLLIICGINLGLRISDLLQLTFNQLKGDSITIVEKKTGKTRILLVNDNIKEVLKYFEDGVNYRLGGNCFVSQKGSVYSTQQINRLIQKHFRGNVSSHSLRKSFGRRVWANHNESDKALFYLSEIFNHTSPSVTRKYLGIRAEEIADVYMGL